MHRCAIAIAASLLSVAAQAAGNAPAPKPAPQTSFESLDKNGDKRISRTEAGLDKEIIDRFAFIDVDADGFVSPMEYANNERNRQAARQPGTP